MSSPRLSKDASFMTNSARLSKDTSLSTEQSYLLKEFTECFDPHDSKSMFFCLVLKNPFSPNKTDEKACKPCNAGCSIVLEGAQSVDHLGFADDSYLDSSVNETVKIVNLCQRLVERKVDIYPQVMRRLKTCQDLENSQEQLYISPDKDQLFILLHMSIDIQFNYAESQSVKFRTHPFSLLGGAPAVFSRQLDTDLAKSVTDFDKKYPNIIPTKYWKWPATATHPPRAIGFMLETPQRARLFERILKTPWEFDGCGLQIDEMKRNSVLVDGFFLLHSDRFARERGLEDWASFKFVFSRPFFQPYESIRRYFGEKIALYFIYLEEYTYSLAFPALVGTGTGIYGVIYGSYDNSTMSFFSLAIIAWSVYWVRRWRQREARFSLEYGTDVEMQQELVRDEFVGQERQLTVEELYQCHFPFPLTLFKRPNGVIIQRLDDHWKRLLKRVLFTYPATLVLVAGLWVALIEITIWRFNNLSNKQIEILANVITIVSMNVFGFIFDYAVTWLNDLENNRTASEHEDSLILKAFTFYFCNAYSALFILLLYPDSRISNEKRLEQLSQQLLTILVVMPGIQNITEIYWPRFMRQLHVRTDVFGGTWLALRSMLFCQSIPETANNLSHILWHESAKDPYTTTTQDYLEITLQYGYMSMFACTFPWGPLASLVYNIIELRIDAIKLLRYLQRPRHEPVTDIGSWNLVFKFLILASIASNAFLLSFQAQTFQQLGLVQDKEAPRAEIFIIVQYVFIALFLVAFLLIPDTPDIVSKNLAKQDILQQQFTMLQMRNRCRLSPTGSPQCSPPNSPKKKSA